MLETVQYISVAQHYLRCISCQSAKKKAEH